MARAVAVSGSTVGVNNLARIKIVVFLLKLITFIFWPYESRLCE
jgi:hypothetical protein